MTKLIGAIAAIFAAMSLAAANTRLTSFNAGWEFRWDDATQWRGTSVPHDAARLRGFDSSVPGGSDQGFFREGVLHYRKSFPKPAGGGRFALKFDGLYMDSTVALNGRTVGGRRNGYVGFEVPLENLAGSEGKLVPVWCYTNGEEAELFLNGRSLGVKRPADTKDLHLAWDVPYGPGRLEVRAKMKDGTVVTDSRETVGKACAFRFATDGADDERVFLRMDAVDASG